MPWTIFQRHSSLIVLKIGQRQKGLAKILKSMYCGHKLEGAQLFGQSVHKALTQRADTLAALHKANIPRKVGSDQGGLCHQSLSTIGPVSEEACLQANHLFPFLLPPSPPSQLLPLKLPIGDRIRHFISAWEHLSQDHWIRKWSGAIVSPSLNSLLYSITLRSPTSLETFSKSRFPPVQGTVSGKNRPSIIYPRSMRSKGFYSRMFAVSQTGWGCISLFWSHWTHTSWIYSLRDLLNQGNRKAKLDLYVHVCYTYLTVQIHFVWEGEVYQFQVLLFGLASATPVFIKLSHAVMAAALLTYTISSPWPIPRATHQSGWFNAPVPGFRSQCKEVCNQSNSTDGVSPESMPLSLQGEEVQKIVKTYHHTKNKDQDTYIAHTLP